MVIRLLLALMLPLAGAAKTNIVFLIADDLGWNDVGYHGSEIKTPNIDALAKKGVELDRYYVYPVCSPTRVAIMTGRTPIRQGIDGPIGFNGGMPLDEHLLPQTLKAAGYQTVQIGKWHLGMERTASHPYSRGFDHSYGHLGPSVDYFTHIWNGGLDWQRNGKVVREEGYSTELITQEAVDRIRRRDKSQPMFLYVAFNAPHTPLQSTEKYLDRYANVDVSDRNRKVFAAMVSAMDDGVGRILEAIEGEGIGKETLIVWVSDNGGNEGAGADNHPLRGGKGTSFEGGIRVPGMIHWPGVLEGGRKLEQIFTAHDWLPTLAAAVGVRAMNSKPLDGVDMWPALSEGKTVKREQVIIGIAGSYTIFRDGWKLVEHTPRGATDAELHLFRIEDDPREERNLIADNPELAKRLLARIRAIPRPPSASRDSDAGDGDAGERSAGRKTGKKAGRKKGGAGGPNPQVGWPEETRAPWVEAAKRD